MPNQRKTELVFSFHKDAPSTRFEKPDFVCRLRCTRCVHGRGTALRCKRRSCIGLDLCWAHLRTDKGLVVKQSTIEGAGKGLFAYAPAATQRLSRRSRPVKFRAGDLIVKYTGAVISASQQSARYGTRTAPYVFQGQGGRRVDAACVRGVASLANTKPGSQNAKINQAHNLVATKVIREGDEIFASYGAAYRLDDESKHSTYRRSIAS